MAGTVLNRIEVLYEDESCVVLNKPAGLAVQGGKGVGVSLDGILARAWGQHPLLVHRLDKDTSGLILVAKTKTAAAYFSGLFSPCSSLRIVKRYLAICKGRPASTEGALAFDLDIRGNLKNSKTYFRMLGTLSDENEFSFLELELGTGRMHQIRRHLAASGNPVLGDDKYGDFSLNKKLRKTMQLRRLLLHSSRLVIPGMPAAIDISAPPPACFSQFLETAGNNSDFFRKCMMGTSKNPGWVSEVP